MIYIRKKKTPVFLRECQSDPFITFKNLRGIDKKQLRESLCDEQNGLCAYCMKRIRPTESGMKVEHLDPQSHNAGNDLDYNNLLAVCYGNMSDASREHTCDTCKGDRELHISPLRPDIEPMIQYRRNGLSAASDKLPDHTKTEVNTDLNEILNLNHKDLQNNRKAVLEGYLIALSRRKEKGKLPDSFWKAEETRYKSGERRTEEYKGIILDYIGKKLRRGKH